MTEKMSEVVSALQNKEYFWYDFYVDILVDVTVRAMGSHFCDITISHEWVLEISILNPAGQGLWAKKPYVIRCATQRTMQFVERIEVSIEKKTALLS